MPHLIVDKLMNLATWPLRIGNGLVRVSFRVADKHYEGYVPADQLFGAVKDILLNREYEYLCGFALEDLQGEVVIDAGAHVGLYALVASRFAKSVIAIEPHPRAYRVLKINTLVNKADNVVLVNRALVGSNNESVKFFASSLYEGTITPIHSQTSYYYVPTITLTEILRTINNSEIVHLKIDVEGAEFEIFNRLDLRSLERIQSIAGEIHSEIGDPTVIFGKLKEAGFRVCWFHPPIRRVRHKIPIYIERPLLRVIYLWILNVVVQLAHRILKLKETRLIIFFAYNSTRPPCSMLGAGHGSHSDLKSLKRRFKGI